MFIDRVVNLQNTVFEDYTKPSYKEQTNSLIHAYKITGDELYVLELMNMYESVFIKQAKKINNRQDREDLVMLLVEIFFTLLDEYNPEHSDFAYYVSKRLGWATLNFIRLDLPKQKHASIEEDYVGEPDVPEVDEDEEIGFVYYQMMDCLTPYQRRIFEQYIGGLTPKEIAELEGMNDSSLVRASITKSKIKLRKKYTEMKADGLL